MECYNPKIPEYLVVKVDKKVLDPEGGNNIYLVKFLYTHTIILCRMNKIDVQN